MRQQQQINPEQTFTVAIKVNGKIFREDTYLETYCLYLEFAVHTRFSFIVLRNRINITNLSAATPSLENGHIIFTRSVFDGQILNIDQIKHYAVLPGSESRTRQTPIL